MILFALEKNTPIRTKGMPRPNEYANRRLKAIEGVVAARVSMVPKIGPTHGVHAAANAKPKTKDSG